MMLQTTPLTKYFSEPKGLQTKHHKLLSLCLATTLLLALSCKNELKEGKDRFSYAVGQQVGESLARQDMKDYVDVGLLAEGIRDALENKGRLSPNEIREAMIQAQTRETPERTAYKKKNQEFLEKNKSKEGVQTTSSGLQYIILKKGNGPKPLLTDKVEVHYKGMLIDGKVFDSSYDRNQPARFPVNGVIQGWQEALQMMPVGSKWKLFIPSSLAYGPRGNPSIPGNSTLVFEVELRKILK